MSIVSLKNVTVKYGSYTAIESANLEIFEGDFIGIIGPNGGGKTTLIKTILGSVPYSGEITLSPTLFDNGRRLIGYLPQQTTFDRQFPISVIEVVLSGLQSHSMAGSDLWKNLGSFLPQKSSSCMKTFFLSAC